MAASSANSFAKFSSSVHQSPLTGPARRASPLPVNTASHLSGGKSQRSRERVACPCAVLGRAGCLRLDAAKVGSCQTKFIDKDIDRPDRIK